MCALLEFIYFQSLVFESEKPLWRNVPN